MIEQGLLAPSPAVSRSGAGRAALAAALVVAAAPAGAQDAWRFAISPYAWLPGLSTSVDTAEGTVDIDTSASDAVSISTLPSWRRRKPAGIAGA